MTPVDLLQLEKATEADLLNIDPAKFQKIFENQSEATSSFVVVLQAPDESDESSGDRH